MRQHPSEHQPRSLFTAPIHSLIALDRSSGMPLYRQICQRLREAILSGELPEGVRLPTERALAAELGVNRTTVMNAYNELASEGLIEGHVGRGTIVKRISLDSDSNGLYEQGVPSWLFGLVDDGEESLGPYERVLSELEVQNEQREVISLVAATPSPDLLPAEMLQH